MEKAQWEEIEAKKEYLNGYRRAKRREQMILEQVQKIRLDAMIPAVSNDGMPKGKGGEHDLSDYIERREELFDELKKDKLEAVREYQKIYKDIKAMKDDEEREALTRYYLMRERWDDIPRKMGIGRTTFYRIYDNALNHFEIQGGAYETEVKRSS